MGRRGERRVRREMRERDITRTQPVLIKIFGKQGCTIPSSLAITVFTLTTMYNNCYLCPSAVELLAHSEMDFVFSFSL